MDDLVHHCLRELAFDGDLGCDVSRLRDFVSDFFSQHTASLTQNVDEAYLVFVWSLIVQQPTVRIGVVPPGVPTEVFVAPQNNKTKARDGDTEPAQVTQLDLIPEAKSKSLAELKIQYGDTLRIAVDGESSFVAITGLHHRPSKLSPMVYTALQFITRGRERGLSVVELGKKTQYDQKTCFYLVKQLIDLDLIVKLRRGGVGSNFCIHKHFFERSSSWREIREEEAHATAGHESSQLVEEGDDVQGGESSPSRGQFDPMDARHLSSLPLVRARIVKLLMASDNRIYPAQNLLVTIGFPNPTKTDRRFFQNRLRELVEEGLIEKVLVASNNKRLPKAKIACIRLVQEDEAGSAQQAEAINVLQGTPDINIQTTRIPNSEKEGLKLSVTLHKQIINVLESTGASGLTLSEISCALCNFDKRTIELLLSRLEANLPPYHLSDLGLAQLMESHARERRFRYYTIPHCQAVVIRDKLDASRIKYCSVDWSGAGEFAPITAEMFYQSEEALKEFMDSFQSKSSTVQQNKPTVGGGIKKGRSEKGSGTRQGAGPSKTQKGRKRKRDDDPVERSSSVQPPPKKRGRPPKKRPVQADEILTQDLIDRDAGLQLPNTIDEENSRPTAPPLPKIRGRPPKNRQSTSIATAPELQANGSSESIVITKTLPKKRGRPRKKAIFPTDPTTSAVFSEEPGQSPTKNMDGQPSVPPDGATKLPSEIVNTLISQTTDQPVVDVPDVVPLRRSPRKAKAVARRGLTDYPPNLPAEPRTPVHVISRTQQVNEASSQEISSASEAFLIPMDTESTTPVNHEVAVQTSAATCSGSSNMMGVDIPIDPPLLSETPHDLQAPTILTADGPSADVHALLSLHTVATGKRVSGDDMGVQHPSKRQKTQGTQKHLRTQGNVSQLRRENELLKVLEELQGIGNVTSKDFLDAHMALVESMASAGGATSSLPGIRVDKRTLEATLDTMESRGDIKSLKTSVVLPTGSSRLVRIVHLPSVSQEQVNAFLAALGRNLSITQQPVIQTIETTLMTAKPPVVQRPALPLQLLQRDKPSLDLERWNRNGERAMQLFEYDDATIREVLLTEKSTLSQKYGYILAKGLRMRAMHLFTLKAFETGPDSPWIVSTDLRIVHLSFYTSDLPLDVYCSLVSTLVHEEALTRLLETSEGRKALVRTLPPALHTSLQIGRSRSRSRFLDMLHALMCLKLVSPLKVSDAEVPTIRCAPNGEHPQALDVDVLANEWTPGNLASAPLYWRFNTTAPVHLWALSGTSPPFWRDMPFQSSVAAAQFWDELQRACTDHAFAKDVPCPPMASSTGPASVDPALKSWIRRKRSWDGLYDLTWHQRVYLRSSLGLHLENPLQDQENTVDALEKLCWIVSAPITVVREFLDKARTKRRHELERARRRIEKQKEHNAENVSSAKVPRTTAAEAKSLIAKKVAIAKEQRAKDWDELLRRVHPDVLKGTAASRVGQVRTKYMNAFTVNKTNWDDEISRAIKEAQIAAETVLMSAPRLAFAPGARAAVPPVVTNAPEKSVEELIAKQGPPRQKEESKRKRKSTKTDEPVGEEQPGVKRPGRRHRFQWDRDFDELARDAFVIINARCRGMRQDLSAFNQVFPAIPRNSVRQRVSHMRESPSVLTYLKRLEDKWYTLWLQHRGTELLPDADPKSTSNFDLAKHIEFLRRHIDKNAMRVGYVERDESFALPADIMEQSCQWAVEEKSSVTPLWDIVWNLNVEEGREKAMLQHPFTTDVEEMPPTSHITTDTTHVAESALKMVFGTPHEDYDSNQASALLHGIGEQPVAIARSNLLSRGVLSKLMKDPKKSKPGRIFKISEMNQNAIGGSIPHDTFQDASSLEAPYGEQEIVWREWDLLSSDGDLAALVQATSEDKVEFKIDTSQPRAARVALDWNSKKADDDQIEPAVFVQFHIEADRQSPVPVSQIDPALIQRAASGDEGQHGQTMSGEIACCSLTSRTGVTDCQACLQTERDFIFARMNARDRDISARILTVVQAAKGAGVSKRSILDQLPEYDPDSIVSVIEQLMEATVPLIFCAGYATLLVVSSAYARAWAVSVSADPPMRVFPRRWIDISGRKMVDVWDAALRAVIGTIVYRPGISQAEVCWRLRSVYDRQEVMEAVRYLSEEGFIKRRTARQIRPSGSGLFPPDEDEEKRTHWFLGERHWYQT